MTENNSVYLAWQAPETRDWHVVGLLKEYHDEYTFNYTNGALRSDKFIAFSGMEDLHKTYLSNELFPLFKNRLLSSRRPEYPNFIRWLGLEDESASPVDLLARSGGLRGTDQLQMFKRVELDDDGRFEHIFFVHGLGHLSEGASKRVSHLEKGDQLLLCIDPQNSYDGDAVLIRADNPAEFIGYCPRYLTKDIKNLLKYDSHAIKVYVESFSESAPANYRLMCKFKGQVDKSFISKFMDSTEFKTVALTA